VCWCFLTVKYWWEKVLLSFYVLFHVVWEGEIILGKDNTKVLRQNT